MSAEARARIQKLTSGVTARIFRLIETAAEDAIRAGNRLTDDIRDVADKVFTRDLFGAD